MHTEKLKTIVWAIVLGMATLSVTVFSRPTGTDSMIHLAKDTKLVAKKDIVLRPYQETISLGECEIRFYYHAYGHVAILKQGTPLTITKTEVKEETGTGYEKVGAGFIAHLSWPENWSLFCEGSNFSIERLEQELSVFFAVEFAPGIDLSKIQDLEVHQKNRGNGFNH